MGPASIGETRRKLPLEASEAEPRQPTAAQVGLGETGEASRSDQAFGWSGLVVASQERAAVWAWPSSGQQAPSQGVQSEQGLEALAALLERRLLERGLTLAQAFALYDSRGCGFVDRNSMGWPLVSATFLSTFRGRRLSLPFWQLLSCLPRRHHRCPP